ncbi:MAG: pirin family protein [Acidimicrobiales bacterium]
MPAVTVEDVLTLPALADPPAQGVSRPVQQRTTAPSGLEGEGFPVKRAFAGVDQRYLDPFIHMDQMGSIHYAPGEPKGTPWHPHRGFETVTYLIDGTFAHQDSTGGGGLITNGATQWMTAGAGILHIEAPPEDLVVSGGLFHGVQLWVNLPSASKWVAPRYQDLAAGDVGLVRSADGGALVRVIAGAVGDQAGPGSTYTPITYVHASIQPGARLVLPWDPTHNALVYALTGVGSVSDAAVSLTGGQLAVLGAGDYIVVDAAPPAPGREPLEILVLGGRPIGEPVAWQGPFVMNTQAELAQAFADFRAGRMGVIPTSA